MLVNQSLQGWLLGLLLGVTVIAVALLWLRSGARLNDLAKQGLQWIRRASIPWQKNPGNTLAAESENASPGQDNSWATLTLFQGEAVLGVIKCPIDQVCERTIGRSTTLCDQIINDSAVSRCHVRVVWEPQGARWYVEDLGSKNGTRLNGLPLRAYSPVPLEPGARLILGRLELTVSADILGNPPAPVA